MKAREVERFLHVQLVVHQVRHDLHVPLRLHVAAHDAERQPRASVLHHHRRHQRVERPLARRQLVGMSGRQRKEAAAILQDDPRVSGDDARAEGFVDRLDERDHVALRVGGGQIDRVPLRLRMVAAFRGRAAAEAKRGVVLRRVVRVDFVAARRRVLLRQHPIERGLRHRREVADPRVAVGERQPFRFDQEMEIGRAVVAERLDVVPLEDVQDFERRHPLRVRRHLQHLVPAVRRRDRLDPVRMVGGEIVRRDETAAPLQVVRDRATDRAAVKRVASAARDLFERRGQRGILEDVAGRGRFPARQKDFRRVRVARQHLRLVAPLPGDDLGDAIAVARVADRRLDRLRQRDRAVLRQQRVPAVHDAGDAHGQLATVGDLVEMTAAEFVERRRRRGAAARVEAVHALRPRVVHDREQVAADAVHRRLDDREHRGGGDRRVDRVAARLQHMQSRGARQRLTRGDRAVSGEHDGARRSRVRRGTIAGKLLSESHRRKYARRCCRHAHEITLRAILPCAAGRVIACCGLGAERACRARRVLRAGC